MRISYSDEEDFSGQFDLWQANCERSLKGKAGQRAMRELHAALLALPSKRLIRGELDDGSDVCAIGALVRHKHLTLKSDPEEMEEVGVECGLPRLVAWKVVEFNDSFDFEWKWRENYRNYTPEERYTAVLNWVGKYLAETEVRA